MLNIVCINAGNYQGQGIKYVNMLHDMVRRNLPQTIEGRFICFADDFTAQGGMPRLGAPMYADGVEVRKLSGDLKGWWNKLWLFSQGLFPAGDRVIYFDLDVCITGALDDLASYDGEFATLTDFYVPQIYNTSVMAWRAGFGKFIWDGWNNAGRPEVVGGDQVALWHNYRGAERLQELFPKAFLSYKQTASLFIPTGAKVVCFHGHPKPAEISTGWVPRVWCKDGISSFDIKLSGNIEASEVLKNIRHALASKIPFVGLPSPSHAHTAVIVGGGPSLNRREIVEEIRGWVEQPGVSIVALNGAWRWLGNIDIRPDIHVMLDAREENTKYIPPDDMATQRLYSAQCHPAVLAATPEAWTRLWFPHYPGLAEHLKEDGIEGAYFGGGSTVGLRALPLLHHLGYRVFHLYGYDSSYENDTHHAYQQTSNDGENKITVDCNGHKYVTTPWMVAQASEFRELAAWMVNNGNAEIHVHGGGLLPDVAHEMMCHTTDTIVQRGGIYWPAKDVAASAIILQETLDIPKILEHVKNRNYCVQAGGNVGLWPRELAKHFGHVWTFEPDETNFRCMALNTENNGKITRIRAGLGEVAGVGSLDREMENCGAYQLCETVDGDTPIIALDDLDLPGCDLLQLDIEGYEILALTGAQKTIEKFHPVIVTEEKGLGDRLGLPVDAVPCLLNSLGYIIAASIGRDVVYTWQPDMKGLSHE